MADYGIKIAKPGKDVYSTDMRDFMLHSRLNTFKILLEITDSVSVSTGVTATYDIYHGLGYKPMILAYFQHPDNDSWYKMQAKADINAGAGYTLVGISTNIDSDTVQIRLYDDPIFAPIPSSPVSVSIKVYILAERREDAWYQPAISDVDNETYSTDYGLKISRQGIDVKTASPENLVFGSSINTLKLFRCEHIAYDAGRNVMNPYVEAHGLDYSPTFITFFNNNNFPGRWSIERSPDGVPVSWADDDNIYYTTPWEGSVLLFIDPLGQ